jgi:hypothetical protein
MLQYILLAVVILACLYYVISPFFRKKQPQSDDPCSNCSGCSNCPLKKK